MPPKRQSKRGKPLTQAERKKIHKLHKKRFSNVKIAANIAEDDYEGKFRNGAKRKTSAAEDRIIRRLAISNRNRSAGEIATMLSQFHGIKLWAQTVTNRLAEKGFRPQLLKKRHLITKKQK
ncbi:MAG: hypothetical protein EZS28_009682 [Streblomastix strix]|uniref:Transposase Tc1-like domain-containing protein n=1 Tax=Streblomastix strix TaxID=222440 RepID=A0A5J4WKG6_9EUKA|nr:MAG: hypothetical protein EZS28_009682 [Streblomastix strix]